MTFKSIKSSDGWAELAFSLKFDQFKIDHKDIDEDELVDKFYTEVINKTFPYGEFGNFTIIVDENFNIVGGHIF